MNLRISGGIYKNRKLSVPESASPVKEKVKNAIFSIIGSKIENAECIDLYAGSGNMGLEAMSRGASKCVFVENDHKAIGEIKKNIKDILDINVGVNISDVTEETVEPKVVEVNKAEVQKYVTKESRHYDIAFMDPPYGSPVNHTLKNLHNIMKPDGIAVFLHSKDDSYDFSELNPNLEVKDIRNYGITSVSILSIA